MPKIHLLVKVSAAFLLLLSAALAISCAPAQPQHRIEPIPDALVAPLIDHGPDGRSEVPVEIAEYAAVTRASSAEGADYEVTVSAAGLVPFYDGEGETFVRAYWVGIGIPDEEGSSYATGKWSDFGSVMDLQFGQPDRTFESGSGKYAAVYWGKVSEPLSEPGFFSAKRSDGTITTYKVHFDVSYAEYPIVVEASDGGRVAGPEKAFENQAVALDVAPQAGYRLEGLSVTAVDGSTVEVDGTGGFSMPGSSVRVKASFVAE